MNLNIVFAVDDGGFDMMAVAMYSVIKNNRNHQLNFHLFHKDISKNNISRLKKLEEKFSNVKIKISLIRSDRFKDIKVNNKNVTNEAYFRYLAPEILSNEPRALYMDFDMLCLGDLKDLYGTDLGDNYIGAIPDYIVENNYDFRRYKKGIGFGEGDKYFNSGLLLLDLDKLRNSKIMSVFWKNLHNKSKIIAEEYNIFADQTVANLTFKDGTKFIDAKYNVFTTALKDTKQKNPSIVHFTGSYKPLTYRNKYTMAYDDIYYTYYKDCMAIIGDDSGLLIKRTLGKLSQEVEEGLRALELKKRQLEEARVHESKLTEHIASLDALIAEERRFKSLLRNIALILDRKITGVLGKDRGLYNPIIKVFYILYRLARWLLSRIVRLAMNLIKKLRSN